MDLPFGPFLLVSRIYHHIFTLMFDGIVHLAADDPVAGPTASLGIDDDVLADLLGSVQDQSMHNSELAVIQVSALEDWLGMKLLTVLQLPELSYPGHLERSPLHHSRIALSGISVHTVSFPIHLTGRGKTGTYLSVTDLSPCFGSLRRFPEHESSEAFSVARRSAYTSSRSARQRFAATLLCLLVSTYSPAERRSVPLRDDHLGVRNASLWKVLTRSQARNRQWQRGHIGGFDTKRAFEGLKPSPHHLLGYISRLSLDMVADGL
jgi:hypothetical protein